MITKKEREGGRTQREENVERMGILHHGILLTRQQLPITKGPQQHTLLHTNGSDQGYLLCETQILDRDLSYRIQGKVDNDDKMWCLGGVMRVRVQRRSGVFAWSPRSAVTSLMLAGLPRQHSGRRKRILTALRKSNDNLQN